MKTHAIFRILVIVILVILAGCAQNSNPEPAATEAIEEPVVQEVVIAEEPQETEATEIVEDAPTSTPEPTEITIIHQMMPGDLPAASLSHASDISCANVAAQKRAMGGDRVSLNSYERPFNAFEMNVYYPFLDIIFSEIYQDAEWIYASITLVNSDDDGNFKGNYAVELDIDLDSRGDFLVIVKAPTSSEWSTEGVYIWEDANNDIGSTNAVWTDAPENGDGYEGLVFDQNNTTDPDMAWARILTGDSPQVQLAFKRSVIQDDSSYLWNVWSGLNALNPAWFDLNDTFSKEDAGSSLVEFEYFYPIKKLEAIDNTCREAVGYQLTGSEPGTCLQEEIQKNSGGDGEVSCPPDQTPCADGFGWYINCECVIFN